MESGFHLGFYFLCMVLGYLALKAILSNSNIFELPKLAAFLGVIWIIPQGIEIESNALNPYANDLFWIYLTACFLCIWWGFWVGSKNKRGVRLRETQAHPQEYDLKRALVAAAVLVVIGQIAHQLVDSVDTSRMGSQWTGVITFYVLLTKASGFGLCLAALIFARTRSLAALSIAIFAAIPLINSAFFSVKREALFDLFFIIFGSWFLVRNTKPSRFYILLALIFGSIVINKTHELRNYVSSEDASLVGALAYSSAYADFNYFDNQQGKASEVGQAQYDFWYMNKYGRWEYGAEYWNSFANQYVPAFLIGRKFKNSLMLDTLPRRLSAGTELGAFSMGSTRTGFSDTYRSLSIFGILIFWIIGYGFGVLYRKALKGGLAAQYLYLALIASGLKAVTHSTSELLSILPFTFLFYILTFRFCRLPQPSHYSLRRLGIFNNRVYRL